MSEDNTSQHKPKIVWLLFRFLDFRTTTSSKILIQHGYFINRVLIPFSKIKSYHWYYMMWCVAMKKEFRLKIKTNMHSDKCYLSKISSPAANFKIVAVELFLLNSRILSGRCEGNIALLFFHLPLVYLFIYFTKNVHYLYWPCILIITLDFKWLLKKLPNQICYQRKLIITHYLYSKMSPEVDKKSVF